MSGIVFPHDHAEVVKNAIATGISLGDNKTMSDKRAAVLADGVLEWLGRYGYFINKIVEPDNHHFAKMCPYCNQSHEVKI